MDPLPEGTAVQYWGNGWGGPGWYWFELEYPEEGSSGPFTTEADAVASVRCASLPPEQWSARDRQYSNRSAAGHPSMVLDSGELGDIVAAHVRRQPGWNLPALDIVFQTRNGGPTATVARAPDPEPGVALENNISFEQRRVSTSDVVWDNELMLLARSGRHAELLAYVRRLLSGAWREGRSAASDVQCKPTNPYEESGK